jgi:hypothetical protein
MTGATLLVGAAAVLLLAVAARVISGRRLPAIWLAWAAGAATVIAVVLWIAVPSCGHSGLCVFHLLRQGWALAAVSMIAIILRSRELRVIQDRGQLIKGF